MSHRSRASLGFTAVAAVLLSSACTIRHSQMMVGEIHPITTRPIQVAETGTELGLAGPSGYSLHEPKSAAELLSLPCEVALAELDYRGHWFGLPVWYFYPSANFPEIKVTQYCAP